MPNKIKIIIFSLAKDLLNFNYVMEKIGKKIKPMIA